MVGKLKTLSVFLMVLVLCTALASAYVVEVAGEKPAGWTCEDAISVEKIYVATSSNYYVGDACSDNAHVKFYECQDEDCKKKAKGRDLYKVDGKLPLLTGLDVGNSYYYTCNVCPKMAEAAVQVCPKAECPQPVSDDAGKKKFAILAFIVGMVIGYLIPRASGATVITTGKGKKKKCPRCHKKVTMRKSGKVKQGPRGGMRDSYVCPDCNYKSMK